MNNQESKMDEEKEDPNLKNHPNKQLILERVKFCLNKRE